MKEWRNGGMAEWWTRDCHRLAAVIPAPIPPFRHSFIPPLLPRPVILCPTLTSSNLLLPYSLGSECVTARRLLFSPYQNGEIIMQANDEHEWSWHRCSLLGCAAGPLRVRPHPHLRDRWSVGYTEGPLYVVPGPQPLCPRCGHWLEELAPTGVTVLARRRSSPRLTHRLRWF